MMSVISLLASVVGWFAARGIDKILGKWVAYVTLAFNKAATESALEEYRNAMDVMKNDMADKYDDWAKWRDSTKGK